MKNILIAGGAGFIGSNLAKRLLDAERKVVVVDNILTGSKSNLEQLLENNNFSFVEADITKDIQGVLGSEKFDEIYHLASPASPNAKSSRSYIAYPIETMLVNSLGTYNLLQIAKSNDAKFLFASSSEVYGDPDVSPQTEGYFGNVNPNGPRSVYDEGKRFGEAMSMGFFRKFGTDIRIIRIFNTYGPSMQPDDGRVVSNFINQALNGQDITIYGDGLQTRSFCFVSDMTLGIQKAMEDGQTAGVYNLGNPDERAVKDVAELIVKMTDSSSNIIFEELPEDDPKKRKPDITKAQQELDFQPTVKFEEGLQKTIEYFKSLI